MVKILFEKDLCLGCKTCELACAAAHSTDKTIAGAIREKEPSRLRITQKNGKLRLEQCMLCAKPKCISACPVEALSKDEVSGVIHVDAALCTGCGLCEEACPFGAISLDVYPTMCDRCNQADELYCVSSCPTKALKAKVI